MSPPRPIGRDTGAEDWHQTFARMSSFSILLLLVTTPLRLWTPQIASGPIVRGIQNWALIFLAASLPLCAGRALRSRAVVGLPCLRRTLLLYVMTIGSLFTILLLRHAAPSWCATSLDFAGGLVLPAISGFTLIMLPHIRIRQMQWAAKACGTACLLILAAIGLAGWSSTVHASPGKPVTPVHHQVGGTGIQPVTADASSYLPSPEFHSSWEWREAMADRS